MFLSLLNRKKDFMAKMDSCSHSHTAATPLRTYATSSWQHTHTRTPVDTEEQRDARGCVKLSPSRSRMRSKSFNCNSLPLSQQIPVDHSLIHHHEEAIAGHPCDDNHYTFEEGVQDSKRHRDGLNSSCGFLPTNDQVLFGRSSRLPTPVDMDMDMVTPNRMPALDPLHPKIRNYVATPTCTSSASINPYISHERYHEEGVMSNVGRGEVAENEVVAAARRRLMRYFDSFHIHPSSSSGRGRDRSWSDTESSTASHLGFIRPSRHSHDEQPAPQALNFTTVFS
jgi:hypothetical protein